MTRAERIKLLLENYNDVELGLRDPTGEGVALPLMNAAWNHPSYRELGRLLGKMRDERPNLYWHLGENYFRYTTKRIFICPWVGDRNQRCELTFDASRVRISVHWHGKRAVNLQPAVKRVVHEGVDPKQVQAAIAWLDQEWGGSCKLPLERVRLATDYCVHKGHDGLAGAPDGLLCIRCNADAARAALQALLTEQKARIEELESLVSYLEDQPLSSQARAHIRAIWSKR